MNCGLFLSGKPRALRAGSFTFKGKATFCSTGFCLAGQTLSPKSIFVFSANFFLLPILSDNIVM